MPRRGPTVIAAYLIFGCGEPDSPAPSPDAASQDTADRATDPSTMSATAGTLASCEAFEYPDRFDVTGDGWGWVDGTCWIDPTWPRQACPEVHLGPPPGPGGDRCQTRADCPADGDDGHWFCGAGACRRFEDEWLTLCVNEAWVGVERWGDGSSKQAHAFPTFYGTLYFQEVYDVVLKTGYVIGYNSDYHQAALLIPFTSGCRSSPQRCELVPPSNVPENLTLSVALSWEVWEDNIANESCNVPSLWPGLAVADVRLTTLAPVVNQGCVGLGDRDSGSTPIEVLEELCVNDAGARISLWYP